GEVDAARVDEVEAPAVPLRLDLVAVARDAGTLVDDRGAPPGQPVDERALAHVGIAEDGDLHAQRSRASCAIRLTTSSTLSAVVSSATAPGAGPSTVRPWPVSRLSRASTSGRTRSTGRPSSSARRRARSSGEAVTKTLTAASGATTVAMSRPSATQS